MKKNAKLIMNKSKEARKGDDFLMRKRVNLRTDAVRLIPVDIWDEDEWRDCTLRDIAIILNQCCGQGVSWQLAYELSKRLNVSYDDVVIAMDTIIHKYAKQTEKQGIEAFRARPHPPIVDREIAEIQRLEKLALDKKKEM